jgi:PAS domain S-box-containing protein
VQERTTGAAAASVAAFDALFARHPVPAWIYLRSTLRIVAVNDAACATYGFERAAFLRLGVLDLRAPDEAARLEERLRVQGPDAVDAGPSRWRHRRADGTELPVEITSSPVAWDGALAVLVLARDLSDEERGRAERRSWDARFEALVAHASGAVALVQETGVIAYVSPSIRPILGFDPWERVGTLLSDMVHPEDRDAAAALFDGGSGPRRGALRLRTRDGGWCPTDAVVQDLRTEPAVGAFVLNARDATERLALEGERARRARDTERRSALQRALLRLYERPWDDAETPFQAVLDEAVAQLGGTYGSALARTGRGTFTFAAVTGFDPERVRPFELPADQVLFGQDWSDGEPRIVADVPTVVRGLPPEVPAALSAYTLEAGIAASLVVPIVLAGRLEAALTIDRRHDAPPFADDAVPLARLFARQVEVALARRTAEADVRHHRDALAAANRALEAQVEQLAALRRIDAAIADQTEPAEVLDVILEQLLLQAQADAAAVLLQDADEGTLGYAATLGLPHHLLRGVALRPGEGLAGRALAERTPVAVDDRAQLARHHAAASPAMLARFDAYTAYPLIAKGRPLGVLEAFYVDGAARGPGHAAFVAAIAAQAAVALDVAQLLAGLRTAAASYRDLANFSGAIEELHDVDALLETGAATLMHEFAMDAAGYFVAHGGALELERSWGEIPDGILRRAAVEWPRGAGAVAAAAATRDVVYVPNYRTWTNAVPGLADFGLKSVLCLPVVHGERVHVLSLARYHDRPELRSEQLTVARAFVRRLEHALERADYLREIEATREEAFRALGIALEYRDYETKGHTDRVVALARHFAAAVGLAPARARALQWGAYLHDLGKIAIPDHVLLKPAKLDADEYALIRTHAAIGEGICRDLRFLPDETRRLVRSHHERWDGAGYPDGLRGAGIPLVARMFSLIDVYDALTSERPYKAAWTHAAALAELERGAGSQFDPELTERFVALLHARERRQVRPATSEAGPNTTS